jgi:thiamine biosynthesis lipoprotein
VEITLPEGLAPRLDDAAAALEAVDEIEAALSLFLPESALCRVNREAAARPVEVDEALFALLDGCRALSAGTGGAFDPTSAPLSRCWGFLRREGRRPDPAALAAARACVGFDLVALDRERRSVRFARPGVELNLGAIGKGHALDVIGGRLARARIAPALLSAGSSSLLALGGGADGSGFLVGLRDPRDHARRLGVVRLADAALGVSGAGEQSYEIDGRRRGHVLDPRTGAPAEAAQLVAVAAPTAAAADALSTAFLVGGRALAAAYVDRHPEIAALVVDEGGVTLVGAVPGARWEIPHAP